MIQVKCFEEDHEEDLEDQLNQFLSELDDDQLTDIKFSVSHFEQSEQIYSFCACFKSCIICIQALVRINIITFFKYSNIGYYAVSEYLFSQYKCVIVKIIIAYVGNRRA